MVSQQLSLFSSDEYAEVHSTLLTDAIEKLANGAGGEARGAIFTRHEVVDFILDLSGYSENHQLFERRILEPSFGKGDFLLPIIRRLMAAWRSSRREGSVLDDLRHAIRAVELHHETYRSTRFKVVAHS